LHCPRFTTEMDVAELFHWRTDHRVQILIPCTLPCQRANLALTEANRGLWPETDAAHRICVQQADERRAGNDLLIAGGRIGAQEP